ncbi:MAG: N-6 DNA methylase [Solirubrobacterales bacterium]
MGVELETRREVTLATGRADAVFNQFLIEWEHPGALAAHVGHPGNVHAVGQVRDQIDGLAEQERRPLERLAGAACDGHFLIFARYRAGHWIPDEPVPVDARSAGQLLDSLVAARAGKALIAQNLLEDFGPATSLARKAGKRLLDQLEQQLGHEPDGLATRLHRQWEEFFAIATGVVGDAEHLKPEAKHALAEVLGARAEDYHPARALFALQTYFALLTKLIASLALSLFVEDVEWDLAELAAGSDDELRDGIRSLERGEPFREAGLANVVEPDVFHWYLEWNDPVRDVVREIVERLKEYDPTTLHVSPEDARDLLKDLYQGLLPKTVRHALGQYFTPDWLAEQLLARVGYEGQEGVRLVDPACGTGTFLVLAINKLKNSLRRAGRPDSESLQVVLDSVVGFDIDPLAVVAARSNYVLALGPLIRDTGEKPVDVPVYLADTIVMPAARETMFAGDRLELETQAGKFPLPKCIDTREELRDVCDIAVSGMDTGWSREDFVKEAAPLCDATDADKGVLASFYQACLDQHEKGLDGLWPRILRNAFMPAFVGRFDLVVGNPPWVNWESLPDAYRERTRPIWEGSGLFVHKGMRSMLGAGKKDVSMLMSYVATKELLRENGRLGFVITQTVFKTAGAGEGFRSFAVKDGPEIRVEHVDDMIDLNPFAGASNRTALVTWRRDAPTEYPVRYLLWQRVVRGRAIRQDSPLKRVVDALTRRMLLVASPVSGGDRRSAWLTAPSEVLPALQRMEEEGEPPYEAHEGVNSGGANGIYWVSVEGPSDECGLVPVTNRHDVGRKKVARQHARVERDLVHPLLRGSDVSRWSATPSEHILFVQDPGTRKGIDPRTMADRFPAALEYLRSFEEELRGRAAFRRYFTRQTDSGREDTAPFWSMFDVGRYTLASHKVAWRDQASEFTAAVVPVGQPLVLPNHKVMFVACKSAGEAQFLCGLLNSLPVRLFVACYAVETQISTHTVKSIRIPKYDKSDPSHKRVADASKKAHKRVSESKPVDEHTVDLAGAAIWGIDEDELGTMRAFLDQLKKRDLA